MHLRVLNRFRVGLVLAIFLLLLGSGMAAPSKSQTKDQANVAQTTADEAGRQYVGTETCTGCHDELAKTFMASPHFLTTKETKMTHGAHGCESCHGPGSAHVEGGGDKSKIFRFATARPDDISRRCLTCHEANTEQRQFMRSTHNENGISCTSCHSIHHSKLEYLLQSKQPSLCFSCHLEQRADFQKPYRHRVLEGLISCSDCHNAHGTATQRQLRTTPNQSEICYKCHSDKRGPFVFEHEPVRSEGCLSCHTPHGSAYPRMLLVARVNNLCFQCHTQAPTGVHSQNNFFRQSCVICHNQIHGSNTHRLLFR